MKLVDFGEDCQVQLHPENKPFMTKVQETVQHLRQQDKEDAFFLVDLGDVVSKVETWRQLLPRVQPFYAVKANGDPSVIRVLHHCGVGFDCASKKEMSEVVGLGVSPSRIIYAHPCKPRAEIRFARQLGVDLTTFDNREELGKIKALHPHTRLLLRMLPPEHYKVAHDFGTKFGCRPHNAAALLRTAKDLGLNVVGVSFNVGTGADDGGVYVSAMKAAAAIFEEARTLGFDFHTLDIGGGFPSCLTTFEKIAKEVRSALEEYFPEDGKVRIMAEPGRYFVEAAFSLTATVIAKRSASTRLDSKDIASEGAESEEAFAYYLNDGVYGSFNCLVFDMSHQHLEARLVKPPKRKEEYVSMVWGPSCDGVDKVLCDVMLPELQVGDALNFESMGAYTLCAASNFNGVPTPLVFYHCSDTVWKKTFDTEQ